MERHGVEYNFTRIFYTTIQTFFSMGLSNIQWTDFTWNIARGCHKVDEDCKYCYMYRDSFDGTRFNPKEVTRTKTVFNMPLRIPKGTKSSVWDGAPLVFVSSLTDWALEEIDSYRGEMWEIIRSRPDLIFQLLTKRPERILQILPEDWGTGYPNVWLGTSAGSPRGADKRIAELLDSKVKAIVKFLSIEPYWRYYDLTHVAAMEGGEYINALTGLYYPSLRKAKGSLNTTDYSGLDWVIVGGESGNSTGKYKYRECKIDWLEEVVEDCEFFNVPVFVKQVGTHIAKELKLQDKHGGDIKHFPQSLQKRQFPTILPGN